MLRVCFTKGDALMRYVSSVLCLVAAFGLAACSKNNQQPVQAQSACNGDPYLMKFGCSVSKVQQAAADGDADAQYALGYMYYYGMGTVRDQDSAKLWIARSAAQGQPLAKRALAMIQGTSSPKSYAPKFAANKAKAKAAPATQLAANKPVVKPAAAAVAKKPVVAKLAQATPHQHPQTVKHTAADDTASVSHEDSHAANAHEGIDLAQMEDTLMHEPVGGYTLQLMGNHNEGVIRNFIASHHLEGKASYYYSTFQHEKWFMLVYGHYKTVQEAHEAIAQLPPELRKMQPWIKPNRDIKAEIKSRHLVS